MNDKSIEEWQVKYYLRHANKTASKNTSRTLVASAGQELISAVL